MVRVHVVDQQVHCECGTVTENAILKGFLLSALSLHSFNLTVCLVPDSFSLPYAENTTR